MCVGLFYGDHRKNLEYAIFYIRYLKSVIEEVITILSDGQDDIKKEKEANDTSYANFHEKRNRNRQSIKLVSIYNRIY